MDKGSALNSMGWTAVALAVSLLMTSGCATTGASRAPEKPAKAADGTLSDPAPTAKTLYAMARLMRAQGQREQEAAVLGRIIAEHPEFVPAYNDLSELYVQEGRREEALALLNKAIERAPGDPVVLNNTGVLALLNRDYEAALANFTRAKERAPRNARYCANVALALGMLGRYEESLSAYREVMSAEDAELNLSMVKKMRSETCGPESAGMSDASTSPPEVEAPAVPTAPPGAESAAP